MHELLKNLHSRSELEFPFVLITVAHTVASAPRESGAKLLVSANKTIGTIGGGNLEFTAIRKARSYLTGSPPSMHTQFVELYALGPMLEQCCGGVVFLHYELVSELNLCPYLLLNPEKASVIVRRSANIDAEPVKQQELLVTSDEHTGSLGELDDYAIDKARSLLDEHRQTSFTILEPLLKTKGVLPDLSDTLLFEVVVPCDFHLVVYGAGHVGTALVNIMGAHPACRITWVDSREDLFPARPGVNVSMISESPLNTLSDMSSNSYFLVMTHDHTLDRELCEAILRRADFRFLGLIGSQTKLRRFVKYLQGRGFSDTQIARLSCPIGIDGIKSKEPSAIAISVSAQLLQLEEERLARQANCNTAQVPLQMTQHGRG